MRPLLLPVGVIEKSIAKEPFRPSQVITMELGGSRLLRIKFPEAMDESLAPRIAPTSAVKAWHNGTPFIFDFVAGWDSETDYDLQLAEYPGESITFQYDPSGTGDKFESLLGVPSEALGPVAVPYP